MTQKHVCVIGPVYSGKTVFMYLMKRKLLSSDYSETIHKFKFEDIGTSKFEKKVETDIENDSWPDPTAEDGPQNILEIHLSRQGILKKTEKCYSLADVAGEIFNQMSNALKEEYANAIQTVRDADAYIFIIDTKQIVENDNINFYNKFIINFKERIVQLNGAIEKCEKHTLVLLNKSDVVKDSVSEKYGHSHDARNFLEERLDIFLGNLRDTFGDKYLTYAWHSSINQTTEDPETGGDNPNYEAFKAVESELYSKAFVNFLNKVEKK